MEASGEKVIQRSAFTGDEITHIYGELEFIREALTLGAMEIDGITAILDEAEKKSQALMNHISDQPIKVNAKN